MKIKHIALTITLLTFLLGSASALPNLKLNWIQYASLSERIVAEVVNDSDEEVDRFLVAFFVDGKEHDVPSSETGFSLGSHSTVKVYSNFADDGNTHHFFAIVDPENEVEESNEEDNTASKRVEGWKEPWQVMQPPSSDNQTDYLSFMLMWGGVVLVAIIIMYFTVKRMVRKRHE